MAGTAANWIRNLTFASMVAAASACAEETPKPAAVEARPSELDGRVKELERRMGKEDAQHQYDWVLWGAFAVAAVAFAGAWERKSISDNELARYEAQADMVAAMWKSLVEENDVRVDTVAALARDLLKMRAPPTDSNEKSKEGGK